MPRYRLAVAFFFGLLAAAALGLAGAAAFFLGLAAAFLPAPQPGPQAEEREQAAEVGQARAAGSTRPPAREARLRPESGATSRSAYRATLPSAQPAAAAAA